MSDLDNKYLSKLASFGALKGTASKIVNTIKSNPTAKKAVDKAKATYNKNPNLAKGLAIGGGGGYVAGKASSDKD